MDEMNKKVSILIPVFNAGKELDETMESIYSQKYNKENIYITAVDFNSTDGSYEKLLAYPSYHLAVYRYAGDFSEKTMIALARRYLDYAYLSGDVCEMVVMPGDVLYPDYLMRMFEAIYQYRKNYLQEQEVVILSEVDVKLIDGNVVHQKALYEKEQLVDVSKQFSECLKIGYRNNVMCFGGNLQTRRYRGFGIYNERIWWNNIIAHNSQNNIIYLPERLSCIKERYYEDELKEVLLRWEDSLYFQRTEEKEAISQKEAEWNIALYALWRSFLLEKKGDKKQARECYKISVVVCPEIEHLELYLWIKELLIENRTERIQQIEEAFFNDREGILAETKKNYTKN